MSITTDASISVLESRTYAEQPCRLAHPIIYVDGHEYVIVNRSGSLLDCIKLITEAIND